jgi:predicted transcriptional regulator
MIEKKREVTQRILVSLYHAWVDHTIISLDPIRETSGLEDGIFHTLVNKLEDQHGFIKAYGSSYTYEITPAGILYVEDNELISSDIVDKHQNIRNAIIAHLVKLFENEGSLADANVDALAVAAGRDKFEIFQDMSFLNEIGYVRDTSVNTYQITEAGFQNFRGDEYEDIV